MTRISVHGIIEGSLLRELPKGQGGQALALALIVIVVASLIIVPVVMLAGTSFLSNRSAQYEAYTVAAAQAGVEAVAADLVRGADAVAVSYSPPSVTVNDITPSVTVSNPVAAALPTPVPVYQYFDPGIRNPDLKTVNPQEGYMLLLRNVLTGTLEINWAYSPAASTRVGVWDRDISPEGFPPGRITSFPTSAQPILDTGSTSAGDVYNRSHVVPVNAGVYSIVFYNHSSNNTITSPDFVPGVGLIDKTWIRGAVYKDYLITSRAGNSEIVAYLRQTPGITEPPTGNWGTSNVGWITNTITVESWQGP